MRNFTTLLFLLYAFAGTAQSLPHIFAPSERAKMPIYLDSRSSASTGVITPPSSPVRTIAEWEELQGLTITWTSYQSILKEIVRAAKEETRVYIVCNNVTTVINYLAANNIDTVNYLNL